MNLFKIPIPADTIVGMYHPWRDVIWNGFTAGVPFKNFLITDPVRQLYPWRQLVINLFKNGQLPLWNPYTHAGTPLLANLQSAALYPLNFLFFLLPFNLAWGILILLQPLLAGIFLYLFLRQLKLRKIACLIGALSFAFSGFFTAWLEWGTVLHTALWLPLILLSIDKILKTKNKKQKTHIKDKKLIAWSILLVFALVSSFFAGHLQTAFYVVLFSLVYLGWRLSQVKSNRPKLIFLFLISYFLSLLITAVQWLPTLQFIKLSARGVDQTQFNQPGWFIPWQNLAQFLAPDFFGNPTTLNYWGVFNYGEFLSYLGVIPLVLAFYALFWHRKKIVLFFAILVFLFLSFALPTPWAKLPYKLKIPLVSTSQPTRLLFLVDFCLAILAGFGMDAFLKEKVSWRKITATLAFFFLIYGLLWCFVLFAPQIWPEASWITNLTVSKRNLMLPTAILAVFAGLTILYWPILRFFKKNKLIIHYSKFIILSAILLLTLFDLLRFNKKFTPLTKEDWIFPSTKTIEFFKNDKSIFRFMTTDRRLFAPNFSLPYKLQTVEGYDPLYLLRYGELIAASERGEPNISPPFGFNRIITPHNYQSRIMDLLNVKYVLTLTDQNSAKLDLVFQEGETRVYENKNAFPRAFMAYDFRVAEDKEEAISFLMDEKIDLEKVAILEEEPALPRSRIEPEPELRTIRDRSLVSIVKYSPNRIELDVETDKQGILILTDSFYPGWKSEIDGKETKIYRANYNFRGIIVPEGSHEVTFKYGWY